MKRAALDSNVYISALHFKKGNPRKILESADKKEFETFVSKPILSEIRGVLRIKFEYPREKLDLFEELIIEMAHIVDPKKRLRVVKEDPADNKIIECALECRADFIVSGDKHLLKLNNYKNIAILSPSEFINILLPKR